MKAWSFVLIPAGIIVAFLATIITWAYLHPKVVDGKATAVTNAVSDIQSDVGEDATASDVWQDTEED